MQDDMDTSNRLPSHASAEGSSIIETWAASPALANVSTRTYTSTRDPVDELRVLYPPILTTAQVAEMMHCTEGDVRDKVHRSELKALQWGRQFRFFRDKVIIALKPFEPDDCLLNSGDDNAEENEETEYEAWFPDIPAVMDSQQLAVLLNTSDQQIRAWTREGMIPAHQRQNGRKLSFLRHEIFRWLIANHYDPKPHQ